MKELIDLYAKLVIGTFTFLGPSVTLLISLFSNQLKKASEVNKVRLQTLVLIDGSNNKAIEKQIKENKHITNLLNPKRQIRIMFGSLLLALMFIGFYHFQNSHFWTCNFQWIRITTILVSATFYGISIWCLWQVFCIIIVAKEEEQNESDQRRAVLKPQTP